MVPKIYLRYDLKFSDDMLEAAYKNSKKHYHRLLLNIILAYGFLIGTVGWIMNPLNQYDYFHWKRIISLVYILSSSIIIFIISLKTPKASRVLHLILILLFFFGFMEFFRNHRKAGDFYLIVGMNKEFMAISIVLAKNSWKTSSTILFLMNMFCAFRYTDFENNYEMKFYPLIQFLLNTFGLSLSSYVLEQYDRECFLKIKAYEYSLSCFKDLITNSFPSAVILIKDDKIIFNNQKALSILECETDKHIMEKLDVLLLEDTSKCLEKQNPKEYLLTEDCRPIINENFNETSIRMPQIINYKSTNMKRYWGALDLTGRKKSLEINLNRIMWENDMVLMVIISENEIIEKIKVINEKSEYKDRLLATVSHDLRTPLNGIMGMIRTTIDINEDALTRKYLSIALRSSHLLLLMINDILDHSQISNGKLRLNYETFCLWNVIKDVSKLFKFQTKMKGLVFCKENMAGDSREDTLIRSDQNRIRQVLFNLLGNALKFTVHGLIKISLLPLKHPENSNSLLETAIEPRRGFMVSVLDTGIGIKKEEQSSLFKLFGRIHNESTATLNKGGVGLGLAISQSLIRVLNNYKNDGEITVVSEYGRGSCFSFKIYSDIKTEEIDDGALFKTNEEKSAKEMATKFVELERRVGRDFKSSNTYKEPKNIPIKRQILVVDDDQINILVVTSYLKAFEEYKFDIAFDGHEAVQKIKTKAEESYYYDLVLMDCDMPKMSGAEAATIIDGMIENKEIPTLDLIACTANASPRDYEFCFKNGKFGYITKPFSKEALRAKIERL